MTIALPQNKETFTSVTLVLSLVARFVNELAEQHRVRRLLHLHTMTEKPELAVADEVVVDVGAGETHDDSVHTSDNLV